MACIKGDVYDWCYYTFNILNFSLITKEAKILVDGDAAATVAQKKNLVGNSRQSIRGEFSADYNKATLYLYDLCHRSSQLLPCFSPRNCYL